MRGIWLSLSATQQDTLIALALLIPVLLLGYLLARGFTPAALVRALLHRHIWTNLAYIALIAISVGLGGALISQERGLREASARAADPFDIIVTAPGDEIGALFATVYTQPSAMPLLDGDIYNAVATHRGTQFAAPLAYGDSFDGHPIIGTTAEFTASMSDDPITGRIWENHTEVVIGAQVPLAIGDGIEPAHGVGDAAEEGAHAGHVLKVVGILPATGSPWDNAILTSAEGVWVTHGLADGHNPSTDPNAPPQLGPPYDAQYFPGTPAIVVKASSLAGAYALQSRFNQQTGTMAFFPGAVLSNLHRTMGDVREVMTMITAVTQVLVATSVLLGLVILTRVFARQMAMLRAIGAPARFVAAVLWLYATLMVAIGILLGLVLSFVLSHLLAGYFGTQTGMAITPRLGWPELHVALAFLLGTALLALIPVLLLVRRPILASLRAS